MSKFDKFLDEYIKNNALPKNKAALKEYCDQLLTNYFSWQAKKRKSPHQFNTETAKQAIHKRWVKSQQSS